MRNLNFGIKRLKYYSDDVCLRKKKSVKSNNPCQSVIQTILQCREKGVGIMRFNLLTIDELGKLDRGRSRHRPRDDKSLYGGLYPFIQTGDVKHTPFYITSYSQTYNEKGLSQSKLWKRGTLCITIAANIADTAILGIDACFPDSILGFISYKDKSNPKFIKYCFDVYKTTLEAISKGTTQDNLSLDKIRKIKFKIPSLPTQRKIAAILSAYDDLIENNNRRIAILEKMAEELYREWFIRLRFPGHEKVKIIKAVPEGWEVKRIGDLADYINGYAFAPEDWKTEGIPIIKIKELKQGITSETPRNSGDNVPKKLHIKNGDILFSWSGSLEVVIWVRGVGLLNQHLFKVIPKENVPRSFLFLGLKTSIPMFERLTTGATMQHIKRKELNHVKLLFPPTSILERFQCIAEPILMQNQVLVSKVNCIILSRDRLLSRLMSGKIDVENLDIQFPASMKEEESADA